ncbi:DNA polymerase alpha accessory factor Mcl1 [Dispira simplex]|nr:DNA polymerase alpha accessory factor Mcl1 [Dispira simplex]
MLDFGNGISRYLFTGGADCLVRGFQSSKEERDQESRTMEAQADSITSIATSRDFVAVGSEDNTVVLYTYPELEYKSMIYRCTMPVRDLQFSYDDQWVGIVSDDNTVRLVQRINVTKVISLRGHICAVRTLSFHPHASRLVSVDSEGTVRIWDYSDENEPTCLKVLPRIAAKSDPDSNSLPPSVKVVWHPSGQRLAIPTPTCEVVLVKDQTWQPDFALGSPSPHTSVVSYCTWSPNGMYLLTIDRACGFVLWDIQRRSAIFQDTHRVAISQVAWCPTANMLAMIDTLGMLVVWDDIIPPESGLVMPHATDNLPLQWSTAGTTDSRHEPGSATAVNETGESAIPRSYHAVPDDPFYPILDSGSDSLQGDTGAIHLHDTGSDLDDFIVDEDGGAKGFEPGHLSNIPPRKSKSGVPSHLFFQPGATSGAGKRRFLAYNMVGSVASIHHDTHCTVSIEFHDKAIHRDFHFTDHYQFTLASLGQRGVLFGAPAQDDDPAVISYRPFESWAANSDWVYHLPKGEDVMALAITTTFSTVITSEGFLRILSSSGLQVSVVAVPAHVVCLTGYGSYFLIVYQSTTHAVGSTGLNYMLYDAEQQAFIQRGDLPLPALTGLQWAGFSDTTGLPGVYDTRGYLHVLHKFRLPGQAQWTPVWNGIMWVPSEDEAKLEDQPNAKEPSDDWLWVVGFNTTQIHGVVCTRREEASFSKQRRTKYSLKRPPPVPQVIRPVITPVDMQMPLLHLDQATTQVEDKLVRTTLFALNRRPDPRPVEFHSELALRNVDPTVLRECLQEDKLTLQLIQSACKMDRIQRALDLATMLHLPKSLDGAIKIAMFYRYGALAERMNLIKESRCMEEEEEEIGSNGYPGDNLTHYGDDKTHRDSRMHSHDEGRTGRQSSDRDGTRRPDNVRGTVPVSPRPRQNITDGFSSPHSARNLESSESHVKEELHNATGGIVTDSAATTITTKTGGFQGTPDTTPNLNSIGPSTAPHPLVSNPFAVTQSITKGNHVLIDNEHLSRSNSFFNVVDGIMNTYQAFNSSQEPTGRDIVGMNHSGNEPSRKPADNRKRPAQATLSSFTLGSTKKKLKGSTTDEVAVVED